MAEFFEMTTDAITQSTISKKETDLLHLWPFELGESYARFEWDHPQIDELMAEVFSRPRQSAGRFGLFARTIYRLSQKLLNPQKGSGAFEIAHRHYDLGNDLFEAMLDDTMTYTCGLWENARNLGEAQTAKLETACRKLGLKAGMRVLDIGCGWGNFAKYACEKYGVSVVGVTVSKEQAELARRRCEGLPVEIRLEDYRNVNEKFDQIVSIEMIEAVGRKNLPEFFDVAHRCLKPNGRFFLQVITGETVSKYSKAAMDDFLMWILKHIFPNGYLPNLPELIEPARSKFVLESVEQFCDDYDQTLLAWCANFDKSWGDLKKQYDERFRRIWRFYLLSCAALFRVRLIQLNQFVYLKGQ